MYSLIKPVLFALDPERAHDLTMAQLEFATCQPAVAKQVERFYGKRVADLPVTCMGLDFRHPVALAAGLDKDARALAGLAALGFSGVEMGTVTPKPQPGNDKPRLFRLEQDQALINRMGFNNVGVDQFLLNLKRSPRSAVAGINIGKNAATSIDDAHYDYVSALQRVYSEADYITVNISSPNTKSLRELQNANYLDHLLTQIKIAHGKCAKVHKRHVPIALKVAPDLEDDEIETIAELVLSHQFDALIATNTTVARPDSLRSKYAGEAGGLSGLPLQSMSTACIAEFYRHLQGRVQIIGVGGIQNADDAWQKLLAGADLLQIYSLFIYQGPGMIADIVKGLKTRVEQAGFNDLATALKELRAQ